MKYLPPISRLVLVFAFAGIGLSSGHADNIKSKLVSVSKILKVTHQIEKSNPPNLFVEATGQVPTAGYTNVQLLRMVYVQPPQDGIQDYYLKAIPPSGIAATVISQVTASKTWKGYPAWVKGIRVHGEKSGIVEIKFDKGPEQSRPVLRRFTGTSKEGSFEKALTDAIAKLNKALPAGSVADVSATWRVVRTSGEVGGIAGQNQIRVIISAERQPAWPQKQRVKKRVQKKKVSAK
jgi:hypothetical protein